MTMTTREKNSKTSSYLLKILESVDVSSITETQPKKYGREDCLKEITRLRAKIEAIELIINNLLVSCAEDDPSKMVTLLNAISLAEKIKNEMINNLAIASKRLGIL
jgi:hypothetical protein